MKRLAIITALLAVAAFAAQAQNNAYSIDDECYAWFQKAEQSIDDFETDAFDLAQQNLLETSLRKKDTKAQTLYYVEQLKYISHEAQYVRNKDIPGWNRQEWNDKVDAGRETLQRIARATGYMQYYYYGFELCLTYYFNTGQDVVAEPMLNSMMEEARETGDEYAMWKSQIYLAKLYLRISDILSTQRNLLEAVRIFEHSQDPTILRQSMTMAYCDLADTYPVASDSARLFYHKGDLSAATKLDSMRVSYYKAQLAAWDNDLAEYRRNRDICLAMPQFYNVIRGGANCIGCIDNIMEGKPLSSYKDLLGGLYARQQLNYVSQLAARYHRWEAAAAVQDLHVYRLYSDIYLINNQHLEEASARYGNNRLAADLVHASQRQTRTTILVAVLLAIILIGALAVTMLHFRNLKRAYAKDEAILADLKKKE